MAKKNNAVKVLSIEESRKMLGANLGFAAAEAYKLLRTNLSFALPDTKKCKVIGVTSSMAGEGKSTSTINMAYMFAQEGKRVLLIEADLRLPTAAKRLNVRPRPGLSNLLVGQCSGNDVLQSCSLNRNIYVITAGDIPPNPAELIGSPQMKETIAALSDVFDIIIVDLPPVTVVTDALIASKFVDGVVIVVRQKYCEKKALAELVRQMKFANAKILGFVMTGADIQKKGYSKKYKTYYKSYETGSKPNKTSLVK